MKPVEPAGISHVEDKRRLVGQSFGLWSLSQLAANFLPLCTPFKQLKVGLQVIDDPLCSGETNQIACILQPLLHSQSFGFQVEQNLQEGKTGL